MTPGPGAGRSRPELGAHTCGELDAADPRPWVLVPLGSTEQHGPHLPLETDTLVATATAQRLAALLAQAADHPAEAAPVGGRPQVLVAPPLTYGSSGEHQSFTGTVSIGTPALTAVLVELVRSLRTWAGRVVLVNGHGGNLDAVRAAVVQLGAEGHDVAWVPCAVPGADAHAGRTETSLLLHLHPESVRTDLLETGETAPVGTLLPRLVAGGVAAVSPNGVLGDPRGSTAAQGSEILEEMARRARDRLTAVEAPLVGS